MEDLLTFLKEGRLDLFMIVGLTIALVWTVKQWREAEKDKDRIQDARIEDVRAMVELATEVKNSVGTLVKLIEGNRRSR
mgnify:CR=1 FL=1